MIGVVFNMNIESLAICPRTNGIYKITNTKTGRFYIGRAEYKKGFFRRWYSHRWQLRKNIHENPYLQNSYKKYGESCFTFEILEIKDYGDPLIDLESEYIINLKAMYFEDGYNITNEKFSGEYPKIYRENHHNSKEFELLSPEGNLIKGRNLSRFCEELDVGVGAMWDVIHGDRKSYKGFKSPNPEFHVVKKEYRLLSPEKELFVFDNAAEFARKIGLDTSSIQKVLKGERSNIKGYHLENPLPEHQRNLDNYFNRKRLSD